LVLSVKAREFDEEKQAMAEYGSSDSGASLGDILGAAFKEKKEAAAKVEGEGEDTPEPEDTPSEETDDATKE